MSLGDNDMMIPPKSVNENPGIAIWGGSINRSTPAPLQGSWKERRALAYSFKEFTDVNLPHKFGWWCCRGKALENKIMSFFRTESKLIYPAKSYFVAIIYAALISEIFNENFVNVIYDKDLLPDDKYFQKGLDRTVVMNVVQELDNLGFQIINNKATLYLSGQKSCLPTIQYFIDEFLIEGAWANYIHGCASMAYRGDKNEFLRPLR